MASNELSFSVEGQQADLSAQRFVDLLSTSLEILRDIDSAISSRRRGTVSWVIGELTYGSPAVMTMRALPAAEERDFGAEVIKHYLDGLQILREGSELPPAFSDDALEAVKKLSRLSRDGIKAVTVRQGSRAVQVTEHIAANVDALLGATFTSTGSIEGTLEMATVHTNPYFRVYDAIHGLGIPCYFGTELIDEVRESFGKRVSVLGRVRSDRMGKPLSIKVDELRVFPAEDDLPSVSDIRGIGKGMLGQQASEDYLRGLRDDDSD